MLTARFQKNLRHFPQRSFSFSDSPGLDNQRHDRKDSAVTHMGLIPFLVCGCWSTEVILLDEIPIGHILKFCLLIVVNTAGGEYSTFYGMGS